MLSSALRNQYGQSAETHSFSWSSVYGVPGSRWEPPLKPSVSACCETLASVANFFPINPLAHGLQYAFNPRTAGPRRNATDVQSLVFWTVVGVFMMVRYLRRPQGEA